MKNPLTTVQRLHGLGRILSTVVFVISIIALITLLTATGVLHNAIKGGKTAEGVFGDGAAVTLESLYGLSAALAVFAMGEISLSRYALGYFTLELVMGTPFNEECAHKLKNLGFLTIAVTVLECICSSVLYSAIEKKYGNMPSLEPRATGGVVLGLMFLVLSLFCRYGSELEEKNRK